MKIVKFNQDGIDEAVQEVKDQNDRDKVENGMAIQRVKDNLEDGECPIECTPLSESKGIIILKCCSLVISAEAASYSISRGCPNCRTTIRMTSLLMIDRNFNLDNIVEEKGILGDEIEELDEEEEEEENDGPMTKFKCIVNIIKGTFNKLKDYRQQRTGFKIAKVLEGPKEMPEAPAGERKVLVFANYTETLKALEKELDTAEISYVHLHGTSHQIHELVKKFYLPAKDSNAVNVLLINAAKYCAGLNLQNATDLIFTHKIVDSNIESQIAGRAARIGRTNRLNVHYVLYHNEFDLMDRNNIS